jgi:hypothetical protein
MTIIPGVLSYDLLARHHFHAMPHAQQRRAINDMAAAGHTDDVIARATGLSTGMICRLLGEHEAKP